MIIKFLKNNFALIASFLASLILSGIIILLLGENPFRIFGIFISSALGSWNNIAYTLFFATPLIFTGLSVAICFRCGLFNIGAEGQLYMGAFACAYVGFTFTDLPGFLLIPLSILFSIGAGGLIGFIPGYLRAKTGAHEVIVTIMLNFIAIGLTGYFVSGPFKNPGDLIPQTQLISNSAHIPKIGELLEILGIKSSIPLNFSFILAVFVCLFIYFVFKYTTFGYEIKAVGLNKKAAAASGINVNLIIILTFVLSGAIAGLVGVNEVMGYRYRFLDGFSAGYGYLGIAVALLGRNHPAGVFISAVIFGAVMRGGLLVDVYSDKISKDFVYIIQGILILFVVSGELWNKFRIQIDAEKQR